MFQSMLVAYAILVLCNVAPEAPSNIEQEKIQAMSFQQHLITVFTYVYTRYFMSEKKNMPSLLWKSAEKNAEILPSNWSNFLSDTLKS